MVWEQPRGGDKCCMVCCRAARQGRAEVRAVPQRSATRTDSRRRHLKAGLRQSHGCGLRAAGGRPWGRRPDQPCRPAFRAAPQFDGLFLWGAAAGRQQANERRRGRRPVAGKQQANEHCWRGPLTSMWSSRRASASARSRRSACTRACKKAMSRAYAGSSLSSGLHTLMWSCCASTTKSP